MSVQRRNKRRQRAGRASGRSFFVELEFRSLYRNQMFCKQRFGGRK